MALPRPDDAGEVAACLWDPFDASLLDDATPETATGLRHEPESGLIHSGVREPGSPAVLTALLWVAAVAGTVTLAYYAYRLVLAGSRPVDLEIYLKAAREVAGGHSPYLVVSPSKGYVYTPLFAILLAPLNHISLQSFVRAWAIGGLGAVALAGLCTTMSESPRLEPWQRPVLFGACACSGILLWPMAIELDIGQIDVFVLVLFSIAALAAQLGPGRRGVAIAAIAASIKLWPILAVVGVLSRSTSRRRRMVILSLGIGAAALATSLAFGGVVGLERAVDQVVRARSQHLISYSVWGIPKLWYSNAGVTPVVDSPFLQLATTALFAFFVGWLAFLVLRRLDRRSPLAFWHLLGCVVLLLPASHLYYAIYLLPLLWHWTARAMRMGCREPVTLVVMAMLTVWWLALLRPWPTDGTAIPWTSSLQVSVVFLVNVLACSASIVGSWLLERRAAPGPVSSPLPASVRAAEHVPEASA